MSVSVNAAAAAAITLLRNPPRPGSRPCPRRDSSTTAYTITSDDDSLPARP